MKKIYNFISFILAAPIVAIYVSIIFAFFGPEQFVNMNRIVAAFLGSLFLGVIPLTTTVMLYKFKAINDVAPKKEDRPMGYVVGIMSFIFALILFYYFDSRVMFLISLAYIVVSSVSLLVNKFSKLSVHVAGVIGPITALVYVFGLGLIPLYVLVLPVAYARIKLKAHSLMEVLLGVIVGFSVTYLTYFIMW
ncbi:MAG: hypothetical protein KJ697_00200 [Nanoarchaeota archaeon]|nr:hypothetical protein [Nanoarchaeota archaeon]MBU4124126.1 hypothetical protein [Nanoarchaeota archaeon]